MKRQLCLGWLILMLLTACSGGPPPAVPAATTPPEVQPTSVPPTSAPPATAPVATDTAVPATQTPAPTATIPAPLSTDTPQPTNTPTAVPPTGRPRPTATSSGPLSANIYVANCRRAPTAEKPGGVIVQISVEASGGNGKYRYFNQDKEWPTKFIDVPGEKGTRLIGEVRVTSGDGQEIKKEFDIAIGELNCP